MSKNLHLAIVGYVPKRPQRSSQDCEAVRKVRCHIRLVEKKEFRARPRGKIVFARGPWLPPSQNTRGMGAPFVFVGAGRAKPGPPPMVTQIRCQADFLVRGVVCDCFRALSSAPQSSSIIRHSFSGSVSLLAAARSRQFFSEVFDFISDMESSPTFLGRASANCSKRLLSVFVPHDGQCRLEFL